MTDAVIMKPNCIKNLAILVSFLMALTTGVFAQTATPTATPAFVAPKLPEIVNLQKAPVYSVDPAWFEGNSAARKRETKCAEGI